MFVYQGYSREEGKQIEQTKTGKPKTNKKKTHATKKSRAYMMDFPMAGMN